MPYLLDADWGIQALAGHQRTVVMLKQLATEGVAISLITIGELYEGAFGSPAPQKHLNALRRFLSVFPPLGLSDAFMERFAEIRSNLRRRGELIPDFDILLGATALHHDLTVLTYNARHLRRIPGLKLHE